VIGTAAVAVAGTLALSMPAALAEHEHEHEDGGTGARHRNAQPVLASCDGHHVGRRVAPGQCLVITARAFLPGEHVAVRLRSSWPTAMPAVADANGVVRYRLVVSQSARGDEVVSLVGQGAPTRAAANGPAGGQAVVVAATVPRFTVVRYRII
jgi:hypothetical protein